jgi:hypothetical protein
MASQMDPIATVCSFCGRRVRWLANVAKRRAAAGLLALSLVAAGAQLASVSGNIPRFDSLGVGDQLAIGSNGYTRWATGIVEMQGRPQAPFSATDVRIHFPDPDEDRAA